MEFIMEFLLPFSIKNCDIQLNESWILKGYRKFGGKGMFESTGDLGLADTNIEEVVCCLKNGNTLHYAIVKFDISIGSIDEVFAYLQVTLSDKTSSDIPEKPLIETLIQILRENHYSSLNNFLELEGKCQFKPTSNLSSF